MAEVAAADEEEDVIAGESPAPLIVPFHWLPLMMMMRCAIWRWRKYSTFDICIFCDPFMKGFTIKVKR